MRVCSFCNGRLVFFVLIFACIHPERIPKESPEESCNLAMVFLFSDELQIQQDGAFLKICNNAGNCISCPGQV